MVVLSKFISASARELKGAVSRVEVEWAKFFFLRDRAFKIFFFKAPHLTDLNRRLVHVDARSNVKTLLSSKSDVDRRTDGWLL